MLESEIKKLTVAITALTEAVLSQQPQAEQPKVEAPQAEQPKVVMKDPDQMRQQITDVCLLISRNVTGGKPQIREVFSKFSAKKVSDLVAADLEPTLAALKAIGGES